MFGEDILHPQLNINFAFDIPTEASLCLLFYGPFFFCLICCMETEARDTRTQNEQVGGKGEGCRDLKETKKLSFFPLRKWHCMHLCSVEGKRC